MEFSTLSDTEKTFFLERRQVACLVFHFRGTVQQMQFIKTTFIAYIVILAVSSFCNWCVFFMSSRTLSEGMGNWTCLNRSLPWVV